MVNGATSQEGNSHHAHRVPPASQTAGQPPAGYMDAAGLIELVKLLREKDEQITELSGQVGFWQGQTQQLKEQVKLLQAPPDEPQPKHRWWHKVWRWSR